MLLERRTRLSSLLRDGLYLLLLLLNETGFVVIMRLHISDRLVRLSWDLALSWCYKWKAEQLDMSRNLLSSDEINVIRFDRALLSDPPKAFIDQTAIRGMRFASGRMHYNKNWKISRRAWAISSDWLIGQFPVS